MIIRLLIRTTNVSHDERTLMRKYYPSLCILPHSFTTRRHPKCRDTLRDFISSMLRAAINQTKMKINRRRVLHVFSNFSAIIHLRDAPNRDHRFPSSIVAVEIFARTRRPLKLLNISSAGELKTKSLINSNLFFFHQRVKLRRIRR